MYTYAVKKTNVFALLMGDSPGDMMIHVLYDADNEKIINKSMLCAVADDMNFDLHVDGKSFEHSRIMELLQDKKDDYNSSFDSLLVEVKAVVIEDSYYVKSSL